MQFDKNRIVWRLGGKLYNLGQIIKRRYLASEDTLLVILKSIYLCNIPQRNRKEPDISRSKIVSSV